MIKSDQKNNVGGFKHLPAEISQQLILMCERSRDPWGIKDLESRYRYVNLATIEQLNIPPTFDIEDKSDDEIPHPIAEFAAHFREHDRKVIETEKNISSLDIYPYGRKEVIQPYIYDKYPLYDNKKKCIGIIFHGRKSLSFSITPFLGRDCPISLVTDPPEGLFTEKEHEIIFCVLQYSSYEKAAEKLVLDYNETAKIMQEIYKKVDVPSLDEFRRFCQIKGFTECVPQRLMKIGSRFIDNVDFSY